MASAAEAEAQAALSQLPACVKAAALQGIALSKCGLNIQCVCQNDNFLAIMQGAILTNCGPGDQAETLAFAAQLCTTAIPSLRDNKGREIEAVVIAIMTLASVAVLLRLVARWLSATKYGIDDLLIGIALIMTYAMDIMYLAAIPVGLGRHIIMLSLSAVQIFTKLFFANQILFACSTTLTKLSILFFYHRIFPMRKFAIISTLTGCIMVASCISLVFAVIFSCQPVAFLWDKTIQGGGHCINESALAYSFTAINIMTDIVVLVLPIPRLWNLQMERAKKLAIIGMVLLGSFVCVAGIIRIPLLTELIVTDVTWTSVGPGLWILVECNIGIVSACLPTMRPLFKRAFVTKTPSPFSSKSKSSKGSARPADEEQPPSVDSLRRAYPDDYHHPDRSVCDGPGGNERWASVSSEPCRSKSTRGQDVEMVPQGQIAVRHDVSWGHKQDL